MKSDPVNGLIAAATGLWCFQQMSLLHFIPKLKSWSVHINHITAHVWINVL